MDQVWIVTLFRKAKPANVLFQFVCYDDEGRANYLASEALDAYHDATSGPADFDYSVRPAPYVGSATAEVIRAARAAAA